MEFPRQEYWSRLPFASPGDLPDPGIEPTSPALQAVSLPLSHQGNSFPIYLVVYWKQCQVRKNEMITVVSVYLLYVWFLIY